MVRCELPGWCLPLCDQLANEVLEGRASLLDACVWILKRRVERRRITVVPDYDLAAGATRRSARCEHKSEQRHKTSKRDESPHKHSPFSAPREYYDVRPETRNGLSPRATIDRMTEPTVPLGEQLQELGAQLDWVREYL
jgi:hypothetical protein